MLSARATYEMHEPSIKPLLSFDWQQRRKEVDMRGEEEGIQELHTENQALRAKSEWISFASSEIPPS